MARIRTTQQGKTAAEAAAAKDIDFRHLWKQLRGVGLTAKRPVGIETEWRYVNPDGSEVFIGEDAGVIHALESGLLIDDELEEQKVEYKASTTTEEAEASGVRASQIDTTAQLSEGTLDDLFGSESDPDVALSQAAVPRTFGLSTEDLETAGSQREEAANLQLLSEASGAESETEAGNDRASTPKPILRPRTSVKMDVNFVPEDENLSSYETGARTFSVTFILWIMKGERSRDKLWKLRPIVNKLQERFLAGWTLPATLRREIQREGSCRISRVATAQKCLWFVMLELRIATAMSRGDWYCVLQNQTFQLKAEDFAGGMVTPPSHCQKRKRAPVRLAHQVEQSEDWVTVSGVQKRRQIL